MHNQQVLSGTDLLIAFQQFHAEFKNLVEKHNILWSGFFKMYQRQLKRNPREFPKSITKIDCLDLKIAGEALKDLYSKNSTLKPNKLFGMYLVTKHRMLVEEQQLFGSECF